MKNKINSTRHVKIGDLKDAFQDVKAATHQQLLNSGGEQYASPMYGYCPLCGELGKTRERRPNGNDTCNNGHTYPSKDCLDPQDKTITPEEFFKKRFQIKGDFLLGNQHRLANISTAILQAELRRREQEEDLKKFPVEYTFQLGYSEYRIEDLTNFVMHTWNNKQTRESVMASLNLVNNLEITLRINHDGSFKVVGVK